MANETAKKDKVLYEKRGKTAIITINRPEAMNTYDSETNINKLAAEACDDPEVWTIIVTGAGEKAFCAGADIKKGIMSDYIAGRPPRDGGKRIRVQERDRGFHFGYLNKPVIAAVNGYCGGGGLEIAVGCDIIIAAEHATFQSAEPRVGYIPGITPPKLPYFIPRNLAMELLMTCRRISAQEAYRIGLVNEVVPLARLIPRCLEICDEINENSPLAIRAIKEVAWKGLMTIPTLSEAIEECSRLLHEVIMPGEDNKEGVHAFMEKRKPVWKCR